MQKELKILSHNIDLLRGYVNSDDMILICFLLKILKSSFSNKITSEVFAKYQEMELKYSNNNIIKDEKTFGIIYSKFKCDFELEDLFLFEEHTSYISLLKKCVVNKYCNLIKENTLSIFIPEAQNFINGLRDIVDRNNNKNFILSTNNELYLNIFKYMFEEYKNVEIIQTNIYNYDFTDRKFDLIFALPALGGKAVEDSSFNFLCKEYDAIATENLLLHLTEKGSLGIILPARITFASGKISKLRDFIQNMYKLEEISELPSESVKNIGIKLYFFHISNGQTDDVSIKRFVFSKKQEELILKDDTFVMKTELENFGDWNINKIFSTQDEEWIKYHNSSTKKIQLADIATAFRGKVITHKKDIGSIGIVNISNLQEYTIDYSNLDHIQEDERKISNYILKQNDLLLSARGTTIKTAVFEEQNYPCIASSNLIVIRPGRQILSTYLKIFLDSDIGVKLVKSLQQGTHLVNINYKDILSLEIPLLPLEEQEDIVKEYTKELKIYTKTIEQAMNRWSDVVLKLQNNF